MKYKRAESKEEKMGTCVISNVVLVPFPILGLLLQSRAVPGGVQNRDSQSGVRMFEYRWS